MEELPHMTAEREAAERVQSLLALPMPEFREEIGACDEDGNKLSFDPWELFPALYGSYSSAFDDLAIEVLGELKDQRFGRDDLAAEMFREMLCVANLCDYGSSPRVCFATPRFVEVLPALIDKWAAYRSLMWE